MSRKSKHKHKCCCPYPAYEYSAYQKPIVKVHVTNIVAAEEDRMPMPRTLPAFQRPVSADIDLDIDEVVMGAEIELDEDLEVDAEMGNQQQQQYWRYR